MEYKKPNTEMIDRYMKPYLNAKEQNDIQKCFLGYDERFRVYNNDSFIKCLTDPEVLLEYVIYPLYLDGDLTVKQALIDTVLKFVDSANPIEFFQAFNYLCGEEMLLKVYKELPFVIFDKNIANRMINRLEQMKLPMQNYKKQDYGKYMNTMYDMVQEIIIASPLFG